VREEELVVECRVLLHTMTLHVEIQDHCLWIPKPDDCYTVHNAYRLLTTTVPHHFVLVFDLIRDRCFLKGVFAHLAPSS